jgi:hypothetical protein
MILASDFYSLPDARKILLDQARQFNKNVQTVTPHSYSAQVDTSSNAGASSTKYFNLTDFDHTTNVAANSRLLFGDLILTFTAVDQPIASCGMYIHVGGFKSDGNLSTPYGHFVYYSSKYSAVGQIDHPQAIIRNVHAAWTYGITYFLESDAAGYIQGQCAVTFNGFLFT